MLCRIGDVEIWRVLEQVTTALPLRRFFPDLSGEALAEHRPLLLPHAIAPDPNGAADGTEGGAEDWIVFPVQAFLLRTPRRLILVDACVGNHKTVVHIPGWNRREDTRFLAALEAAGARPEDVDLVLCTHLHVDHAGWTTRLRDGRWVPTFPNARVLATAADLAFAEAKARADPAATAAFIWSETVAPLLEAGRLDIVAPDARIDEAVRLRATPGHTPGHVSVEIRGAPGPFPAGALITGDAIHSPLQCALPDLCPVVDASAPQARATRRALLEELSETGRMALATHFPLPSAGHFRRAGAAWRWAPCL